MKEGHRRMQGMDQPLIFKGFHESKLISAVIDLNDSRTGRTEVNLDIIVFKGRWLDAEIVLSGKKNEQNEDADYGVGA
jgi:hypothetical protein